MEIEKHGSDVQRIERFQSLQSGQYWRAKADVPKHGIKAEEVLLLESIRWVDDAAHTIVMRAHPLKHGTTEYVEYTDENGAKQRTRVTYGEHRFLLDDFLLKFEFEHDAEEVRAAELAAIQAEVDGIKGELVDFRQNPQTVAAIVDKALEEADANKAAEDGPKLPALTNDAAQAVASVATGSVANALAGGVTEHKIAVLKAAAAREHQIATIKSSWIAGRTKLIGETIKKMTPFYAEQAAAALAQTEDTRTYVAKLEKGMASLDLYIGKGVTVDTVRTGDPAPSGVPLAIVQKKLCMDEELAVFLDLDEWFDFTRQHLFFEALKTNDALVNQVFPTERCVLVMTTTRRHIDYGDGLTSALNNLSNHVVFLLVRDGWNIHVVVSPVESHLGASRLFPSRGDGDAVFRGYDGRQIKFDDLSFTDKLATHENQAIHYKRFLILLAGLDHREKLFGDFYDEADALEFVSDTFQEKYFFFIRDADNSANLPGVQRQDVSSWIKQANGYVQSGSRILANWNELIDEKSAPSCFDKVRYGRDKPYQRYSPSDRYSVATVYREGTDLLVDVEVTGETLAYKTRTFKARVNLTAYAKNVWGAVELPYLCLDKISPDDIDWYIHHRGSRADHLTYIRIFKTAYRHVQGERAAEAATRALMAQALRDGKVVQEEAIAGTVNEAVATWRAANRGKPLPKPQGVLPPHGWKALLDLMYHSARGEGEMAAMAEEWLKDTGMEPLRLSVGGDGRIALYATPRAQDRDDRIEPHVWVQRIVLEFKDGKAEERSRRWARVQKADASEKLLREWDGISDWYDLKAAFATPEAKAGALSAFTDIGERIKLLSVKDAEAFEKLFAAWRTARAELNAKARFVSNPAIYLPIGLETDKSGYTTMIALSLEKAHSVLARIAPDEAARERLLKSFVSIYGKPERGDENFRKDEGNVGEWRLVKLSGELRAKPFMFLDERDNYGEVREDRRVDPLMDDALETLVSRREHRSVYLAPGVRDADGCFMLDGLLGLARPEGYGPYYLTKVTLSDGNGKAVENGCFTDVSLIRPKAGQGMDGLPSAFKDKGYRWSSFTSSVATMDDVRVEIADREKELGVSAKSHTEFGEDMRAAEGVDRWYFPK